MWHQFFPSVYEKSRKGNSLWKLQGKEELIIIE